jgi:hypothetical protein
MYKFVGVFFDFFAHTPTSDASIPVIASRLGAMAKIVEDGRTGLHFTSGDRRTSPERLNGQ